VEPYRIAAGVPMLSAVGVTARTADNDRRLIRLRYAAVCADCGISLSKGTDAYWNSTERKATCLACVLPAGETDPGTPGASAIAEGERRKNRRVEEVRRQYGDYAAEVAEELAARDAAASWGRGGTGETRLASFVAREVGDSVIPLHDRLIPGTRGNIDHIFVAATGIWVVDSKAYKGKVERREDGPIWKRTNELWIDGRNRSRLANGLEKQVSAVIAALERDEAFKGTNVHAALCLVDSEWALFNFPFQIGNVWVLYAGALRKRLKKSGPLSRETMERIAHRLDLSLPRATTDSR